ncbi:alpha/beta hydrolase [Rhodococcoides trifolii]|uniref:Alpha/beta hydrolase n=1 Tax=Rhodococcoides trifolii TaxID=908250 RepID=A0A917G6L2_9NOCA|nr:alpha/beta hydrolase [Rhodococcus trifolii]GGG24458.1 alpha/beta hydrolase [Rhodococcus trifolii]
MTGIVFVHGALVRDGAWWWGPVSELLQASSGLSSRSVQLPSCAEGASHDAGAGLAEDAAALRRSLDEADDDLIVVGHSYGGTVMAEGADHPNVRHLVYISSYLPSVGQAQGELLSSERDPVAVRPSSAGMLEVDGYDQESFGARFLQDVDDPAVRANAWSRVTEQSVAAFTTPTTRAAWQGRESTYFVCAEDRSTSAGLQRRHAARATRSIELPTGHHPFLSRPDLVANHLREVVDAS